jgi:hypothetical protein
MSGFPVVENELGKVYGQFLRLISHNRATFSSYYTAITKENFIDSFIITTERSSVVWNQPQKLSINFSLVMSV